MKNDPYNIERIDSVELPKVDILKDYETSLHIMINSLMDRCLLDIAETYTVDDMPVYLKKNMEHIHEERGDCVYLLKVTIDVHDEPSHGCWELDSAGFERLEEVL